MSVAVIGGGLSCGKAGWMPGKTNCGVPRLLSSCRVSSMTNVAAESADCGLTSVGVVVICICIQSGIDEIGEGTAVADDEVEERPRLGCFGAARLSASSENSVVQDGSQISSSWFCSAAGASEASSELARRAAAAVRPRFRSFERPSCSGCLSRVFGNTHGMRFSRQRALQWERLREPPPRISGALSPCCPVRRALAGPVVRPAADTGNYGANSLPLGVLCGHRVSQTLIKRERGGPTSECFRTKFSALSSRAPAAAARVSSSRKQQGPLVARDRSQRLHEGNRRSQLCEPTSISDAARRPRARSSLFA